MNATTAMGIAMAKMGAGTFLAYLKALGQTELSGEIRTSALELYRGIGELYAGDPDFFPPANEVNALAPPKAAKPKAKAKTK